MKCMTIMMMLLVYGVFAADDVYDVYVTILSRSGGSASYKALGTKGTYNGITGCLENQSFDCELGYEDNMIKCRRWVSTCGSISSVASGLNSCGNYVLASNSC